MGGFGTQIAFLLANTVVSLYVLSREPVTKKVPLVHISYSYAQLACIRLYALRVHSLTDELRSCIPAKRRNS